MMFSQPDATRLDLNTVFKSDRGQFADRVKTIEGIYCGSDQDYDSRHEKT